VPEEIPISENVGHYYRSLRKRPLRARFAALPPFRLAYTIVLATLLVPSFLIFIYSWGWDRRSVGIRVSVLKSGSTVDYMTMPAFVRIEDAGADVRPHLYLNSTPVLWGELASALRNQLKLRPDWVVYVEADEHILWADVVNAMDIIRGTNAKVVLLTTKTAEVHGR
jgi:biopolymer transport protein ExbD